MSNTNDNEIISKFTEMSVGSDSDMISREIAWIPDSNGSSYNGQITFDLSSLGQSNKWLSYKEAYIQIPYVIAAKGSVNITAAVNKNLILLKDGFHQIIDNISVEMNNKTVVQVQNFTNVHTQFKMLTKSSTNDVIKNSTTTGFFTDNINTYTYRAAASIVGVGYCNNTNSQTNTRSDNLVLDTMNLDATRLNTIDYDKAINSGRSYYKNNGLAAADGIYYWVYMATIRLSDITDIFDKIPLTKCTDVRLTITYNAINTTLDVSGNLLSVDSYQQVSGHCNPILIKSIITADQKINIQSNVMKTSLINPTTAITSCRLYMPVYKTTDAVSLAMIQSYPSTKFEYNDLYTYVIPSIKGSEAFTHTLTTGIVNPMYVVVVPFPKTNSLARLASATYQSSFDTAPSTTSAITLQDFNVQLAGLNVFQTNQHYDFEQFNHELSKINAVFGNNVLGMTSGLLSMSQFQNGYRYYVADLSRREKSQDFLTKSIVITGTNVVNLEIELICFVAYKKTIVLNTATGLLVE